MPSQKFLSLLRLSRHDIKNAGQSFGRMCLRTAYLRLPYGFIQVMHVGQEQHTSDIVSLSARHVRGHVMSCPSPGDVHFHNLIKVARSSILHCKGTIFPFSVTKYFMQRFGGVLFIIHSLTNFHSLV